MVRGRAVAAHFGTQGLALALCVMVARPAEVIPRVEVLEGDGAINNIKLHRAKEPVVRVADQDGHPLANVAVTFLLPEKGPGGSFADGKNTLTVMTDADGRAVGRGLRPNNSAGQFQIHVTASFQGQGRGGQHYANQRDAGAGRIVEDVADRATDWRGGGGRRRGGGVGQGWVVVIHHAATYEYRRGDHSGIAELRAPMRR